MSGKSAYILPEGNVQIAFSGGRTSAYMLHQILEANGGLPDNWRVYKHESVKNSTKVRLTGALVRPVDPEFEPHIKRDFDWIKPEMGRAQMTVTLEQYRTFFAQEPTP